MNRQTGFTLLEVLIAMVIIAIGLLGISALQSHAMRAEVESYQRAQALILADDMINRIDANRDTKQCYADTGLPLQAGYNMTGIINCTTYGVPDTQARANRDAAAWHRLLTGATVTTADGQQVGSMIKTFGCVTYDGIDTMNVYVFWQGLTATVEAPFPPECAGVPDYGGMRRVVARTLRAPDLP